MSGPVAPPPYMLADLSKWKKLAREIQADAPKMGNWRALVAAALLGGRE